MSSKKFLIAVGAVVLAGASAFAGHSVRFGNVSTAYYKTTGGTCKQLVSAVATAGSLTTGGTGTQAQIKTQASGTLKSLWKSSACAVAVHFRNI